MYNYILPAVASTTWYVSHYQSSNFESSLPLTNLKTNHYPNYTFHRNYPEKQKTTISFKTRPIFSNQTEFTLIVLSSIYPLESGSLSVCGLLIYLRRYTITPAALTAQDKPITAKHIPDIAPASRIVAR